MAIMANGVDRFLLCVMILKMVEEDRYCMDISNQLLATP